MRTMEKLNAVVALMQTQAPFYEYIDEFALVNAENVTFESDITWV